MLTILSIVAATFAATGSLMFVNRKHADGTISDAQYDTGSMVFLCGNATTIALGLHLGDMTLVSAQLGLVWFTLPMYKEHKHAKAFTIGCLAYFVGLLIFLGVSTKLHFTASYLGAAASIIAIYGAWLMSKFRFTAMAWCWLIADLIFIYVAVLNKLPILGVLAAIFVYHSACRLLGYTRVGLLKMEKAA
jgi:hypothetical protein